MRALRDDDAVLIGTGCVTALGRGVPASFAALAAGTSAVTVASDGPPAHAIVDPPLLTSEVPEALEPQIKFLNGAGMLAVDATAEAMAEAGLLEHGIAPERRGLFLAQVDSEAWSCHEFRPAIVAATEGFTVPLASRQLNAAAARRIKPFFMLESLKNNAFSFLATLHELRGTNVSVAGLAGSTLVALDLAVRGLAHDRLDAAVLVGAARPAGAIARAEMAALGIHPPAGDAAATLVLERRADAAWHGADASGPSILGWGAATYAASDPPWQPSTAALVSATRQALAEAEVEPDDLAAVIVPGLGEAGLQEALEKLPGVAGRPLLDWTAPTGHVALAALPLRLVLAAHALAVGRLPRAPEIRAPRALLVLDAGLLGQAGAVVLGLG